MQCEGENKGWNIVHRSFRDLAPDEVLIKVFASGLCATDHQVHDGIWPGLNYPRIAGHEIVGRVAKIRAEAKWNEFRNHRIQVGSLVGVGFVGFYCGFCDACRSGDNSGCRNIKATGLDIDGGHAEYVYVHHSGAYFENLI